MESFQVTPGVHIRQLTDPHVPQDVHIYGGTPTICEERVYMERVWIELVHDESERIGMRGVCLRFICVVLESYIMFLQSLQCAMDDNVKLCRAMLMTLLMWLQNLWPT
jgi:hypothetical protein